MRTAFGGWRRRREGEEKESRFRERICDGEKEENGTRGEFGKEKTKSTYATTTPC
jgi:hypothetical protein